MTCPGSVTLIEQTPRSRDVSSPAAAIGTAIHEACELALTKKRSMQSFVGKTVNKVELTQEHVNIGKTYVDYVSRLKGDKYYEQRVSVSQVVDNCFGTADAIVGRDGHIAVIDLKTGSGVKVHAQDNTQLMIYALGAFYKFDVIYDIQELTLIIVQPPFDLFDEVRISVEELRAFEKQLKTAVDRINNEPDTYVPSVDACRWCPAQHACPAHRDAANDAAAADFSDVKDDLSHWLDKVPLLEQFCKAVKDEALKRLMEDSQSVPGYKPVAGRGQRKWIDPSEAEQEMAARFKAAGLEPDSIYKTEFLSVAQLEKLAKKAKVDYDDLVKISQGAPQVAQTDDKRPALSSAREDFAK